MTRPSRTTAALAAALALGLAARASQGGAPPSGAPAASGAPPLVQAAPDAAPAPEVAAWEGSLGHGLAEIERLSDAGEVDAASAVADRLLAPTRFLRWRAEAVARPGWRARALRAADPLLDLLGLHARTAPQRGAVEYARGVALARGARRAGSEAAFEAARALAGPGELRLAATYDLGTSALEEGEEHRAKIPEVSGAPPAAAPGGPPAPRPAGPAGAGAPGGEPDPLELARAAYLRARERLVERLRADWRDADAQANVELVQRRLKELDRIEKEREQQQKDQEQPPKDQPPQPDQQGEGDQQKKPDEQPPQEPEPKQEPPKPEDEPKPEDAQEPPPEPEAQERELTREEVLQLLDRLAELEEQMKQLREQQRARRVRVKKDW